MGLKLGDANSTNADYGSGDGTDPLLGFAEQFIPGIGDSGGLSDFLTNFVPQQDSFAGVKTAATVDQSVTFNGGNFGHDATVVQDSIHKGQLEASRPKMRALPKP